MYIYGKHRKWKTLFLAFLFGLSNKRATAAVQFLQPTTLVNAYRWVKKEVKTDSNENFRQISNPTPDLVEKIRLRRKGVDELEILRSQRSSKDHREVKNTQPRQNTRRNMNSQSYARDIKCFNCGILGHYTRNCTKPIVCKQCNKVAHDARFHKSKQKGFVRHTRNQSSISGDSEYSLD